MSKKTLRPAIAMIELIFALVIIGIVLMTAPMLIRTAAKSGYVTIQQEGIGQAASRVSMIMGYPWDEGNVDNSTFNTILTTNSGVSDLNESNRTLTNGFVLEGYRVGTPMESLRNFIGPDLVTPRVYASSTLGSDSGDMDDIDDFSSTTPIGFKLEGTGDDADYVENNVSIATSIIYIDDDTDEINYDHSSITFNPNFTTPAAGRSNIKEISVTLTSISGSPDELNKTIILRAFSCNIGGYKLEEKDTN